ncbi:MAG TPA: NAD(P)/FAD-dependent oxidoreductase [Candidatus Acidoferrales bacterium]
MEHANVVIIGGGVVGCAVARALSSRWDDVFLLEAMPKLGMGASSRNSGVIHSGLYYHPGSLKAKHCVRGNQLTYEFCAAHNVPHRKIGKLVVASSQEEEKDLLALVENGRANGLEGLSILDRDAIRAREPHVEGFKAIGVPSTGIVASEELVKTYARVATENGANIVTHARVEHLDPAGECLRVVSTAGEIETRCLVNSAGLFADEVAALLGSKMAQHRIYPVRGEYCELIREKHDLVRGLVYPLPHADGLSLGVHLTKTLWGSVLVGPTAHYISDKNDYERDREPVEYFANLAKKLLPSVTPSDFVPAYSGIRAKLIPPPGSSGAVPKATGMADFIIQSDPDFPRAIHLIGIESPGLTSAPSIAEHVTRLVSEVLA